MSLVILRIVSAYDKLQGHFGYLPPNGDLLKHIAPQPSNSRAQL